jgi:thioredoxin 1
MILNGNAVENMNTNQDKAQAVEVGETNFEAEVLKSQQPVLVVFWAPWSRPCQILRPVFEEVVAAYAGKVKVVKVNADDNPGLGVGYQIQSIPAVLYFVGGCERARIIGTASKEAILSRLKPFIEAT